MKPQREETADLEVLINSVEYHRALQQPLQWINLHKTNAANEKLVKQTSNKILLTINIL